MTGVKQWTLSAVPHPLRNDFRLTRQTHDSVVGSQEETVFRAHQSASACGDSHPLFLNRVRENLRFQLSETAFTLAGKYLGHATADQAFDLFVRIDEFQSEAPGQKTTHGRLSGPHEAGENQIPHCAADL